MFRGGIPQPPDIERELARTELRRRPARWAVFALAALVLGAAFLAGRHVSQQQISPLRGFADATIPAAPSP